MIRSARRSKSHRCCGCYSTATRIVPDGDGVSLHLCDRCPDPDEIRRRSAAGPCHLESQATAGGVRDGVPRHGGVPRDSRGSPRIPRFTPGSANHVHRRLS